MTGSNRSLKHADAARMLGVSSKALRVYEDRGLVVPGRTAAGWRVYGPTELARAADVVALRELGLSLGEIERVLAGDGRDLQSALENHQLVLEARMQALVLAAARVRELRSALSQGQRPELTALRQAVGHSVEPEIAFDLPWPWGGERFVLHQLTALTFIIGPLGSGKTRLARRLAEVIEGGFFMDLSRLDGDGAAALARLEADAELRAQVDKAQAWLADDGATLTPALTALLVGILGTKASTIVIDMVEDGLDHRTQEALIAYLRRARAIPRLMLMTRSSAILDPAAMGADEAILFCPANHSPPSLVAPYPGAPGFEAMASCLATPEVRARTAGVVVMHADRNDQPARSNRPG